jgi:serine/threonine protein kinase
MGQKDEHIEPRDDGDPSRTLASPKPPHEVGGHIGCYKLLSMLGEGGFGVVYLAEQDRPIRRLVALKVVKPGMDTKQVVTRFETERQALAMLDHPHIARVFDAGATEAGRPYFVMEYVKGIPITEYCDKHRLGTEERLRLFIPLCQAIQHAHHKGIIHRDIKPSNVLVTLHDERPIPKIIDFGVAKALNQRLTERTLFTEQGQMIGTPEYMSPEQAELTGLDVDTRADIYSLGVLLYELLTGCTPFDPEDLRSKGYVQMQRIICEQEPVKPSTKLTTLGGAMEDVARRRRATPEQLRKSVRGDLDWIVMKAMEKDRARRYETASALALDIERYLNNEAVTARPPSRLYRFRKTVQRNKLAFVAAAAVLASLCLGLGLSTWLFVRERAAHRQAVAAIHFREERDRLQENQRKLTEAVSIRAREPGGSELKYGDEVERLIRDIPISEIPDEHLFDFVSYLGVWHATHGRWKQANDYFAAVLRESHRPTLASFPYSPQAFGLVYFRYAITLLQVGDVGDYNELRQMAVSNYAGTTDAGIAGEIAGLALLRPVDEKLLSALKPMSELMAKFIAEAKGKIPEESLRWPQATMALWEYRSGNYDAVERWCQESSADQYRDDENMARIANLQLLLAMAHVRLGNTDLAQSELAQAGEIIRAGFDDGVRTVSTWHDWLFDRLLLGEAQGLIPRQVDSPERVK